MRVALICGVLLIQSVVGGTGLDASGMRLDLFARAIRLNAGIYADSIDAVARAGDMTCTDATDGTITVTAGGGIGTPPYASRSTLQGKLWPLARYALQARGR